MMDGLRAGLQVRCDVEARSRVRMRLRVGVKTTPYGRPSPEMARMSGPQLMVCPMAVGSAMLQYRGQAVRFRVKMGSFSTQIGLKHRHAHSKHGICAAKVHLMLICVLLSSMSVASARIQQYRA